MTALRSVYAAARSPAKGEVPRPLLQLGSLGAKWGAIAG